MKTSSSPWIRGLLVAAGLWAAACGSDVGGVPDIDGSSGAKVDGATDAGLGSDGGSPAGDGASADGATTTDVAVTSDVARDQGASMDSSSLPDTSVQPDGSTVDVVGDGTGPLDATGDGGGGADARGDVSASDARLDAPIEAGGGDVSQDARDAGDDRGPTGPACGNGVKDPGEECDDGNKLDFDGCSSLCADRRACDCCERENDPDTKYCQDMQGVADTGPKAGSKKSDLCQEAYACFIRTKCAYYPVGDPSYPGVAAQMDCFCGAGNSATSGNACNGPPVGACKDEMLAGLEIDETSPSEQAARVGELISQTGVLGGGNAMWWAAFVDGQACPFECLVPDPEWAFCPNPDNRDGGTDAADAADAPADTTADGADGPDSAMMSIP